MKILCVEDGSVDMLNLENAGLTLGDVVIYRQGSNPPYLIDNGQDLKDLHLEIVENSNHTFKDKEMFYEIPAIKLREIFEKRIKGE